MAKIKQRKMTAVDKAAKKRLLTMLEEHDGSYKAVALALGLEEKHRSAVYSVVKRGSRSAVIYEALDLPYHVAKEVVLCPCGQLHDRDCKEGKEIAHREAMKGKMIPLHPAAAARLGIPGQTEISALTLLKHIQQTAVPFLERKRKEVLDNEQQTS